MAKSFTDYRKTTNQAPAYDVIMTDRAKQISDEQLLGKYQGGDSIAFETLVKRYEKELYHFLFRFMGQSSLAEEAFQEAFLQVHVSAAQFETSRRFRPWLYTIAANKARDILRNRMRRPSVQLTVPDDDSSESELWAHLLSVDDTPDKELDLAEQKEIVRETVARMPENLRQILVMAYFNQLPYKEISEILEIPLGTVKSRLHAAVKVFSQMYKETQ
jgi:RNA polymerase sigma-70 factor (ECF subfamily)